MDVEAQDILFSVSQQQVYFNQKMMVRYPEKVVFILEIENQGENEITIDFKESTLGKVRAGHKYHYGTLEMEPVHISAHRKVQAEISFDFSTDKAYFPDDVEYVFTINDIWTYQKRLVVDDNSDSTEDSEIDVEAEE